MRPIRRLLSPLALSLAFLGLPGCGRATVARPLTWYTTCGDPVCRGYGPPPGTPRCSAEKAGDACAVEGLTCDPVDACNRLLLCSSRDPKLSGCPISSRGQKTDLRYLTTEDLDRYARELRRIRLASYRYRGVPGPPRLGFVLEDQPPEAAVDPERDMVDLYGYTSLAVAALQAQAREVDALKIEVAELRRALAARDWRRAGAKGAIMPRWGAGPGPPRARWCEWPCSSPW